MGVEGVVRVVEGVRGERGFRSRGGEKMIGVEGVVRGWVRG